MPYTVIHDGDVLDVVQIARREGRSSAEIRAFGATLTSWKSDDVEHLWLSSDAVFDRTKAIRGGIPLVFPQFGKGPLYPPQQHGFARNNTWSLVGVKEDPSSVTAHLRLTDATCSAYDKSAYPHAFQLDYHVTLLEGGCLRTKMVVSNHNSDGASMPFQLLFHTYFRISDIGNVRVRGLQGIPMFDKVTGRRGTERREQLSIESETDSIYSNTPDTVEILDGSDAVIAVKEGLGDIVVWNPWEEKAGAMADFENSGYLNMICVEFGNVDRQIDVHPGEQVECSQTLRPRGYSKANEKL